MAMPGEVTGGASEVICSECGRKLKLSVLHSGAGYYLGYFCPNDGPYGRESHYFLTEAEAIGALESGMLELRDTGHHPGPLDVTAG